jgi:hypothetical protein
VPVTFSEIRARTQAIQVLLDQGYGKPPQTVRQEVDMPDSPFDKLTEAQQDQALAAARRRLAQLESMTPEERIADMEANLAEAKARLASSNGTRD